MLLRHPLRHPFRPALNAALGILLGAGAAAFTPAALFSAGEVGAHYETYDPSTLLARRNQFTYTEFPNGTADLSAAVGPVASSSMTGYDGAIAVGHDGVTTAQLRKIGTDSSGVPVVLSVIVEMDDGNAPQFLGGVNAVDTDFGLVVANAALNPLIYPYNVESLGGSRYRVWVAYTPTGVSTTNGINKYTTNSTRTFKVTAWQFDRYATTPTTYQKVTDWNTEYMAAALSSIGMWQDSTGTTPVTAVEQPVGLWLDTKQGFSFGTPTVATGFTNASWDVFTADGAGFTAEKTLAGGTDVAYSNDLHSVTQNSTYRIKFTVTATTLSAYNAYLSQTTNARSTKASFSGTGEKVCYVVANVASGNFSVAIDTTQLGSITVAPGSVSVEEVVGYHATQASGPSRPILSARYNLLTKTEQFDDAAWAKSSCTASSGVTDPLGGTKAGTITATSASARYSQTTTAPSGSEVRAYLRRRTGTGLINWWDGATFQTIAVTDAWQEFSFSYTAASAKLDILINASGDAIDIAFPSVRAANDVALNQPTYQRVNTATDYDTAGFIHYLKFDGTDDSFQTPTIPFATDKIAVWAGVTKLSDAAAAVLCELGATSLTQAFAIFAPGTSTVPHYSFRSSGSATATANTTNIFSAPVSSVLTGRGSVADDLAELRVNGSVAVTVATDQGTGNYAAAALNIGRRNNASAPFTGRLTSLTARATSTPTSEAFIRNMEQYAARLAGQTFTSA